MKTPTQKQIEAWKEAHGGASVLVMEDGKEAYLKKPNMLDYKRAMSAMGNGGKIAYTLAMLDALWLDGDEEIKTDESYFNQVRDEMDNMLVFDEAEIVHHDDHVEIIVQGKIAKVKRVERTHLKSAERKNPNQVPFRDKEELFKLVKIEADPVFDDPKDADYRMPLYLALDSTQRKKYGTLKKL